MNQRRRITRPVRTFTLAVVTVVAAALLTVPQATSAAAEDRVDAAAVAAGTVVFIRSGNVWIARANGAGARAITRDGTAKDPYRSPTQDDRGRIFALRGHGAKALVSKLDQNGKLLNRYGVPIRSFGPDFVSVSPDGAKLAYETMFARTDCSFTPCHTIFQHTVEYAAASSGKALSGSHGVTDTDFASWAGNGRTVLQTRALNTVRLHRATEKTAVEWFASCLSYQAGCEDTDTLNYAPAVNRQGNRLAISRLEDRNGTKFAYLLVVSTANATTANPPAPPGAGCAHPAAAPTADFPARTDLTVSAPSFSPDGRSVVFAERVGSS